MLFPSGLYSSTARRWGMVLSATVAWERRPRRRHPPSEKRRIVGLTWNPVRASGRTKISACNPAGESP